MRALLTDPAAPAGVRFATAAEPEPRPDQVLIDVHHIGLNRGELRENALPASGVHGFEASGVVVRPAADGSGPRAGARVVAFGPAAWAQRMPVNTGDVAEVPASVDLADAAALPVAGLAALRALRAGGPVAGKRVLVTGASGAVGRFAVALATHGGAHVVAATRRRQSVTAHQVVDEPGAVDQPVDVVIDSVGGRQLVDAWGRLAPGGNVQSIGWASEEPAVFPPYSTFLPGRARALNSFGDISPAAADLGTLLRLVADGVLTEVTGWRGTWDRIADAAAELLGGRLFGKAVLDVTGSQA